MPEILQIRLTERDFLDMDEGYLEALYPSCDATPDGLVFCEINVGTLFAPAINSNEVNR